MANMNYKPGWYFTYFLYCMIPVSIYVYYLFQRRKDDYIVDEVFQVTSLASLTLKMLPIPIVLELKFQTFDIYRKLSFRR